MCFNLDALSAQCIVVSLGSSIVIMKFAINFVRWRGKSLIIASDLWSVDHGLEPWPGTAA